MGVSPAVAGASRSRQEFAGRMPTPERARRPRYVQGISAFTFRPHPLTSAATPLFILAGAMLRQPLGWQVLT